MRNENDEDVVRRRVFLSKTIRQIPPSPCDYGLKAHQTETGKPGKIVFFPGLRFTIGRNTRLFQPIAHFLVQQPLSTPLMKVFESGSAKKRRFPTEYTKYGCTAAFPQKRQDTVLPRLSGRRERAPFPQLPAINFPTYSVSRIPNTPLTLRTLVLWINFPVRFSCLP
jgi:hypothetical protein